MDSNILVSFVIPAYNSENYILKCINSIVENIDPKFKYEIIVVNDGSKDGTINVVNDLLVKNDFIKLYNIENNGVSNARNIGIEKSIGKYVCFVDSDDFFLNNKINDLIELSLENDLDIIRGKYVVFDGVSFNINVCKTSKSIDKKVVDGRMYLKECVQSNTVEVVPWLGLFKRKYLVNNTLLFPQGIGYEEDQLFFLKALINEENNKVMQTDICYYSYNASSGGVTKKQNLKQAIDVINVVKLEKQFIDKLTISKEYMKIAYKYISASFYQLTSIYGRISKQERKELIKVLDFKVANFCLKNAFNFHQKVKIFCFIYLRILIDLFYKIKI